MPLFQANDVPADFFPKRKKPLTYITLFSSAGVGCYGFKMNGYRCIATNELLPQRIAVQKANHKCEFESGYICGDITRPETQAKLFREIEWWKEHQGLEQVDVLFATPPCQGMSTVNYKKSDHEQVRNSLVVQAIKIIKEVHPKVFVFENVRAFLKSVCTDLSGTDMLIKDSILTNLSKEYNIHSEILNFKDFGVPSSRPRTLVIGTSKGLPEISPLNLFPVRRKEITVRQAIGSFAPLEFGAKDASDPLHFARPFPEHQIPWIADLKEGQSAFDQPKEKQPYTFDKAGNRQEMKGSYMGNKYRRLFWDRPGACIATRNDVLSSQDTIHPSDNRVLSIREVMRLMTIPDTFRWSEDDAYLTVDNSDAYLRKYEMNIRHCMGEAVPTEIIRCISAKINTMLDYVDCVRNAEDIGEYNVYANYSALLANQAEIFDQIHNLDTSVTHVTLLVESVKGFVNYVPQMCSLFALCDKIRVMVAVQDNKSKETIRAFMKEMDFGENVRIALVDDSDAGKYDYVLDDASCKTYESAVNPSLFDV